MKIIASLLFMGLAILGWSQEVDPDAQRHVWENSESDTARLEALESLIAYYKSRSIDTARSYIEQGKMMTKDVDAAAYQNMIFFEAEVDFNAGAYDDALNAYHQFIDFHESHDDTARAAQGYNGVSLVHLYTGNYDSTVHFALNCLDIFAKAKDTLGLIQVYYRLAQANAQMDKNEPSLEYMKKGINLAEAIKHNFYVPAGYNGIANVYLETSGDIRESSESEFLRIQEIALNYYKKAEEGFEALGIDQYRAAVLHNMALIELNLEKWRVAKKHLLQGLELSKAYANPQQKHSHESSLAVAKFNLGEYDTAEALLLDGLAFYRANNDVQGLQSNLKRLRDLFALKGDYKASLKYANEYQSVQEDIFQESKVKQSEELAVQYDAEKKEQQVALLSAKNENAALRLKSAQRLSIGLGVFSLLVIGFAVSLYRLNRKINDQKGLIERSLTEKDVLLKEIHHRVKNNLQVVSSLLNLQSRHLEDAGAQKALQEGQNRVKSMAIIHQRLYQEDNLKGIQVQEYITRLAKSLFQSYNIKDDQIKLELTIADLNIDIDTLIPLGLILNELLTNSLKYAFPYDRQGVIKVILEEKEERLHLLVHDNGIGLDKERSSKLESSFGYQLINAFSAQLDAQLSVVGEKGTKVGLSIKDYKMAG